MILFLLLVHLFRTVKRGQTNAPPNRAIIQLFNFLHVPQQILSRCQIADRAVNNFLVIIQCWRVLTDPCSEHKNICFFMLQVPKFGPQNMKYNLH